MKRFTEWETPVMEEGAEQEEAGEPSDCNTGLIPVKGEGQGDWRGEA